MTVINRPPSPKPQFGLPGGNAAGSPTSTNNNNPSTNPALFGIPSGQENDPVSALIPPSLSSSIGDLPSMVSGPSSVKTIAQALAEAQHFSKQDIIWLQDQLTQAGYFNSQTSNSSDKPINGVMDPATLHAYTLLLLDSFRTGSSSQQILQDRQAGLSSSLNPTKSLPGIIGHGDNMTLDLTNPTDLNFAADKTYERLLERASTPAEKAQLISEIQAQQTTQGKTKFEAVNATAFGQFQDRVNQQNQNLAANASIKNPGSTTGLGPDGQPSFSNPTQFAVALAQAMGWSTSDSNITAIVAWELREGGNWQNNARFNPLNTTQTAPGSTPINSVNVQSFTSWQQGLQATVQTLHNGHYADILQAFQSGDASKNLANAGAGLKTWSGSGYTGLQPLLTAAKSRINQDGGIAAATSTPADPTGALATANAMPTPGGPSSANAAGIPVPVQVASSMVGKVRYQWGGTDPATGLDCSGLTQYAYKQIGINIGRTTSDQWANPAGQKISLAQAQPGDLVFFGSPTDNSNAHVGIYIGNGKMIDAPHPGANVRTVNISGFGNLLGVKRFTGTGSSSATTVGTGSSDPNTIPGQTFGDTQVGDSTFTPGQLTTTTNAADPGAQAYADIQADPARRREFDSTTSTGVYSTMLGIIKNSGLQPASGTGGANI